MHASATPNRPYRTTLGIYKDVKLKQLDDISTKNQLIGECDSRLEFFAFGRILNTLGYNVEKVFSENERNPFAINAKLLFKMSQEVTEVYVEDIAIFVDHNIVRIAVPDAQNESGHAVTSARVGERLNRLIIPVNTINSIRI